MPGIHQPRERVEWRQTCKICTNTSVKKNIRALVDHFYDAMDDLPEAQTIRAMHPDDLAESRDKFFWFLVGWSGGPPLYTSKFGHPRLRMRHLPFEVDSSARDAWMLCMKVALEKVVEEEDVRTTLFRPSTESQTI